MLARPTQRLAVARDDIRADGTRDYMEAILEIISRSDGDFSKILNSAEGMKAVIGENVCEGSFGDNCLNIETSDTCFPVGFFEDYLTEIPVDPKRGYSQLQTGYYIFVENGILEVGSCEAEDLNRVKLTVPLENID